MTIRRATSADYVIWLGKKAWHKSEAAFLFSGLEPDSVRESPSWDPEAFPCLGDSSFQREEEVFASFFPLFKNDRQFNRLESDDLPPIVWLNWATSRGLTVPTELTQAASAQSKDNFDEPKSEEMMAASDHSGGPGRPTSMHLVLAKFEERKLANILAETVTMERDFLATWVKKTYPALAPPTPKTIGNNIAARFRQAKATPEIK